MSLFQRGCDKQTVFTVSGKGSVIGVKFAETGDPFISWNILFLSGG